MPTLDKIRMRAASMSASPQRPALTGHSLLPPGPRHMLIASGASGVQVAHQMGHSKIETTKNIYGHLFARTAPSSWTP